MTTTAHDNMSFLEHLEELRWHVIRSLIAIISAGFICFLMKDFIFDTIIFGPKKMDFTTNKFLCKSETFIGV
jgi:sec-independent protein translocase protein TatC